MYFGGLCFITDRSTTVIPYRDMVSRVLRAGVRWIQFREKIKPRLRIYEQSAEIRKLTKDANAILIPQDKAELAMDAAACIGCGACVAACPNASAMLFVGAKVSHLALLPQGKPEAASRVLSMVREMDHQGFGNCTNETECEAECPKEISIINIARLNREFIKAGVGSSAT